MSETHSPVTAADPSTSWIDAYLTGNREDAEKLFQARNSSDGVGPGRVQHHAPTSPAEPPAIEQTELQEVAESVRALGPEGEALLAEWGGENGQDFAQNVAFARAAVQHVAATDPELVRIFFDEIEHPDGRVTRLADSVSLHRLLAEYGRLRAHRDGIEVLPILDTPIASKTGTRTMPNRTPTTPAARSPANSQAVNDKIDDLTAAMHAAVSRGDRMMATRLDRELQQLHATSGNEPIVGRDGRNA